MDNNAVSPTKPYRLIVVDDENEVRGRITKKISAQSGFEVVGTAGNGYDAIELVEQLQPHVVLTDIKMPYVDGLELAAMIKQDHPTVRVAFLTGYDEFDYAQKAINLNVISYLTKPATEQDIAEFLLKLRKELDKERAEQLAIRQLQDQYQATIPLLAENYLKSLLTAPALEQPEQQPELKGVIIEGDYLLVQIKTTLPPGTYSILEEEKLKISLRLLVDNILTRHNLPFHTLQFGGSLLCILHMQSPPTLGAPSTFATSNTAIDAIFFEIMKVSEKILSLNLHLGVSNLHHSILDLSSAYKETNRALHNASLLGPSDIVYASQLQKSKPDTFTIPIAQLQQLEYTAKMGTIEEVTTAFKELSESFLGSQVTGVAMQNLLIHLAHIITSVAESLEMSHTIAGQGSLLQVLDRIKGQQEALDWALKTVVQIRQENLKGNVSRAENLFEQACAGIALNYTNPKLSMADICDELQISQSYISLLFKQHSTTFVKQLTKARIEKAKELLARTPLRIIEIAERCGYSDVYYFSHSFKKYQGVSPKKYREESKT